LALEEQLASRRSLMDQGNQPSCRFTTPFKPRTVVRSASSSVFSQVPSIGESAFTDELSKVDSAFSGDFFDSQISNNNSNPPGMVQSSQSDNSSECDIDAVSLTSESPEDCAAEEWAAALIDQSMVKENAALLFGRDRSISESSQSSSSDGSFSDALSKSPVGFWTVRPGSSSIDDTSEDDDEPISWTPSLQSSSHPVRDSLLSEEQYGPPHFLSPSGFSSSNLGKLLAESAVTGFNTSPLDESSHPSSDADDELGPFTPADQTSLPVSSFSSFKPLKKTMCRSISYSAFSTYKTAEPNTDSKAKLFQSTAIRASLSSTQESDLFRTYFMKFVDLLVVREPERLIHRKEATKA
jgi:hypothetical protein